MDFEIKEKLNKLKKENKIRIAKTQVTNILSEYYNINISTQDFIDYEISNNIYKGIYRFLEKDFIKRKRFFYDTKVIEENLKWLFNIIEPIKNNNVLIFPLISPNEYNSINLVYLDYPVAITSTIETFKKYITKVIYDLKEDIVVVDKELKYGFVIFEDEYEYINIEFWGI